MYLTNGALLKGGDYRIVRHIASGGFGNTYEGLDVNLNKRVAIKEFFVKDFCVRDAGSTRVTVTVPGKKALIEYLKCKFVEEARAIAKMEHENIVNVQALFDENGTAYYVMDFIDGESVGDLLKRRGSLPESEAVPIICKVASALDYMHKRNRFHLDVKPANIMLRKDGKVVLIDFGSSKQYAELDGENTTTIAPCYTTGYAPSEQMNPKPTKFTAATDVYALGATLYKMLTGVTPPSAIDLQNEDEMLPPLPAEISEGVRECVKKAMIPQRNKRLQSIAEFLASLKTENDERTIKDFGTPRMEEERLRQETEAQTANERAKAQVEAERKVREEAERLRKEKETECKRKEETKKSERNLFLVLVGVVVAIGLILFYNQNSAEVLSQDDPGSNDTVSNGPIDDGPPQPPTSGYKNGHEWIDLGLSVKWANTNVGATSPSAYGGFYAWAETYTKSCYNNESYFEDVHFVFPNEEGPFPDVFNINGGRTTISPSSEYDVARAKWGDTWRLPSKAECDELCNDCSWSWETMDGHKGFKIVGPNGNSIFLPASGIYGNRFDDGDGKYHGPGGGGTYWTSNLNDNRFAYALVFSCNGYQHTMGEARSCGGSVRPVTD